LFLRTVSSNGKKHIHFSDLKAVYTGQYGFNTWNLNFTVNSDYVSFDGCVTQYSYHDAVALSGRNLLWENGQALDVRGSQTLSQHYSKAYVSASPAAPGESQHGKNIVFRNSTVGNTETISGQILSTVLPCEMYVGNVLYENIDVNAPSLVLLGNQTTQIGPYNITYRKIHSKSTVSNNFAEYGYTTGMVVENLIYDVMSGNKSTIQFENAVNPVFRYSKVTGPNTSANGFVFGGQSQNGRVLYNIGISHYVFVDVENSTGLVIAGNTVYGGVGGVRLVLTDSVFDIPSPERRGYKHVL
jgi:hypothetical protein